MEGDMRNAFLCAGVLTLISVLSGCGEKQPDLTPEQQMNAIMEATSPFGDAEIRMNEAMTKAVGVSVGDSWVRKMIEHHRGAIAMSQIVLRQSPDAKTRQMAEKSIAEQNKSIGELQAMLQSMGKRPQ